MAAHIGHNGGPPLGGSSADVAAALRAEIARLRERAEGVARGRVSREVGGLDMATRFAPSRLRKCPTDRKLLERVSAAYEVEELAATPSADPRLERKLARLEGTL